MNWENIIKSNISKMRKEADGTLVYAVDIDDLDKGIRDLLQASDYPYGKFWGSIYIRKLVGNKTTWHPNLKDYEQSTGICGVYSLTTEDLVEVQLYDTQGNPLPPQRGNWTPMQLKYPGGEESMHYDLNAISHAHGVRAYKLHPDQVGIQVLRVQYSEEQKSRTTKQECTITVPDTDAETGEESQWTDTITQHPITNEEAATLYIYANYTGKKRLSMLKQFGLEPPTVSDEKGIRKLNPDNLLMKELLTKDWFVIPDKRHGRPGMRSYPILNSKGRARVPEIDEGDFLGEFKEIATRNPKEGFMAPISLTDDKWWEEITEDDPDKDDDRSFSPTGRGLM